MAFKMNPALKAYSKSAGNNRVMKMDPSAMKKDLPEVIITAENGRNQDGTVDKNSRRYKDAVAAANRKKENEKKQKALDKRNADGLDNLSYADKTNLSQQNKTKTTKFTKKAISSTDSGDETVPMQKKKTYNQAWADMSEAQKGKFANKQAFVDKAKVYNRTKFGTTEPTKVAKEASKATGEKVTKKDLRKTDYSAAIRVDKMKQTTSPPSSERHDQVVKDLDKFDNKQIAAASTKTGKDDRKYRKARKARNQAEKEVYLKGNTKRAQRKFAKAIKKEIKGDKARKA